MKKFGICLLLLVCLLMLHYALHQADLSFSDLRLWLESKGSLGPFLLISLYLLASIVLFPASLLTLLGGALYGPWLAFLYITVGANLGASLAFFLGRYFGFAFAKKIITKYFPNVEEGIRKNGFAWVFGLRLLPITPFVFFNYAAGLTPLRWRDYALGSLLGMFPMTFVYCTVGFTIGEIADSGQIRWAEPSTWGPFLLALILAFFAKRLTR